MQNLSNGFRQRLWRWHFFAGLIVCPFLILLSVTGSIYLFKAEIENWQEQKINAMSAYTETIRTEKGHPLGEKILLQNVLAHYPGAKLVRLTLAKEGDRTVEFDILPKEISDHGQKLGEHAHHNQANNQKLTIWVDRYSGTLLETKISNDRFLNVVKKLHSELLLGNNASYIVELVASWAIILLISGVVLWSHKSKSVGKSMALKTTRQIFSPRVKTNKRFNWRALHGVIGVYLAIPLFLMLITGLPWTQLWGNGFKEIKEFAGWSGPKQEWRVTLKSRDHVDNKTLPEINLWEISGNESRSQNHYNKVVSEGPRYTLSDIASNPALELLNHPIYIYPPKLDNGVWTVRSMPQDRSKRVTLHFDQSSGRQLMRIDFDDYHAVQRVVSSGISLHEGALFGTLNKILVLITACLTIGLSILGLMTWWKRRPSNSFGIPSRVNQNLPATWVTTILMLCLFLPAAGISILVVIVLDYVWNAFLELKHATIDV